MKIIDTQLGKNCEFIVNESEGQLIVEVKANVLGNAEDIRLPFSIKSILLALLANSTGMTAFILKVVIGLLL